MDIAERLARYQAVEEYRKRPLIVYATSTRVGVPGQMAGDAVREFIDQINAITEGDGVDILMHSTGGDALAAWKLMSVLRERFGNVAVVVPYMAFSAATIFALGANEIVMHPHASLGPIDPQVRVQSPDGKQRSFSYEDVGAFLRFVGEEVKLTEQAYVSSVIEKLFGEADPLIVGGAKRASELSTEVGERLLSMHMTSAEERQRARQIAENLNKSFFSHSDAVSRSRARDLQLNIAASNPELERLVWDCYLGLESYMQLRENFDALQHLLKDQAAAAALAPMAPIQLPPNAPPQLVQQVFKIAGDAAVQGLSLKGVEVEFSVVNALVESRRLASEFRTTGTLSACRFPDGSIKVSSVITEAGWKQVRVG
jgi:hypothetical protein